MMQRIKRGMDTSSCSRVWAAMRRKDAGHVPGQIPGRLLLASLRLTAFKNAGLEASRRGCRAEAGVDLVMDTLARIEYGIAA